MKFAILTFGCRTNQADSFVLDREIRARGGEEGDVANADVVVVNTCAVTATAEQAARQAVRRVARINPSARIVATGCYATRRPADFESLPVCRAVPKSTTFGRTLGLSDLPFGQSDCLAPMPGPGTRGRTIHLLRVQTGCDERCTYCVVPDTRGPSRSAEAGAVVDELRDALDAGFNETMITGVHLGSYGRDLQPATSLADLVRRCSGLLADPAVGRDTRLRLSAIEPMDVSDDLITAAAESRAVVPHFHLPLQHASDQILSAMARSYTLEQFSATVGKLLDRFPDASIGTDLIAGFPGETARDFETCVAYLTESPLAYVHVFPFSPRPGTAAATLSGRPAGAEVRRRVGALRSIAADLNRRFRSRFIGTVRGALTIEDGTLVLTDNYLRVRIPSGHSRNERVKVRIERDGEPMSGAVIPASAQSV